MTDWLGPDADPQHLTFLEVGVRALLVCTATLVLVRIAHRRFLAQLSTFDTIVAFLLASTLARDINGTAAFWPTLGGGLVIVLVHRVLADLSARVPALAAMLKDEPDVLIRNGLILHHRLRAHGLSREDLLEQARLNGCVDHESAIRLATLERNGQISIVRQTPNSDEDREAEKRHADPHA